MMVSDQPHFGQCTPVKEPPVPFKWEAEWAPDLAWTLWGRKTSPVNAGNQTVVPWSSIV